MRLWHKNLIKVLPQKQLVSQWRELCCIAKNIKTKETPNHILVNKILLYDQKDFICYSKLVILEFKKRNYKISEKSLDDFYKNLNITKEYFDEMDMKISDIYKDWHNERYYKQCYYNLEEKFDCGGITEKEFKKIKNNL